MGDLLPQTLPVACTLGPAEQGSRRDRWLALGDRALVEQRATATGAQLLFEAGSATESELRSLALAERECCGFATWEVRRGPDALVLDVDAPPDAVPTVWALFELDPGA